MINKLAIVLALVIVAEIIAHQEAASSAALGSSDEIMERRRDVGGRRTLYRQEYEGLPIELPIELPSRRMDAEEPNASIETKADVGRRSSRLEPRYEGLAIELPPGRRLDNDNALDTTTTTSKLPTTTTTSTSTGPLLDRRYRRIYSPDEVAAIEHHPYMAALLVNHELWCGAVVIARDSALTAAHCLQLQYNNRFFREYVKMLALRVGSSNATFGGELFRVSEIFFHPNYQPQSLEFNVALVKVHKNMTFGKEQPMINMIDYSRNKVVPVDSKILFLGWGSVLGFGGTGSQVFLQKVELPVYDLADCQEIYGRELVTRNNFCAGYITLPKNVCNHDAGGPAILDGVLVGILSFSAKRCDQPDQPAVFSAIGAVAPWLQGLREKKFQLRNTEIKTS